MMKIKAKNSFVRKFKDIPVGQVFCYKDHIFMKIISVKTPGSGTDIANAVRLEGEPHAIWFYDEDEVIPYTNAELTLSF